MAGWVVLAQPLQHLLVVHEPVQRAQEEGVERQVAHLLQLEVSAQVLQPPRAPDAGLQRLQSLAVLPQVGSQVLGVGEGARLAELHAHAVRPARRAETQISSAFVSSFHYISTFLVSQFISLFQFSR